MGTQTTSDVATVPYWSDSASLPTSPKLDRNVDVDVAIVGGGITGLTTAYLLAKTGKAVAVLERATCGQIDTGHTSAHLTMVADTRLTELARQFGASHAQALWDAGLAAINQIDSIILDNEIACDFDWIDGYLHVPTPAENGQTVRELMEEAALAQELGFDATFVEDVPFMGGPGMKVEGQARFHPRKYLAGLVRILVEGGAVFEHTNAAEFSKRPRGIKTDGGFVRCRDIVVATHDPLVGIASQRNAARFQTKLSLYSTYVVAGRVSRGTIPDALFWDTGEPYHYLRLAPHSDHDLVIFGGEDHKTGQATDTNACYDRLEHALRARVPQISLTHRWSGQVIETPDGLPYIGQMTAHQYAATGFAGNGLTFGTLAAMMISDALQERQNPWSGLLDPRRTVLRHGLWEYIKENADYPYYRIRDRFAGAETRSLRAIGRGRGKVIEYQGVQVAAYCDSRGVVTLRSAVCTHMGCVVAWNDAERTWDCPCHGSRFEPTGAVISGPAEDPLPPVHE
jgi:glycine/D-amino acid oxidase-like deaminating enzyme/nitrite reductase/ring-hydroxylating ferredoxin subunit